MVNEDKNDPGMGSAGKDALFSNFFGEVGKT